MDDLLYQIKHEFSPREADALDSLVQGCRDVYDLNLSAPPSTETKDRVKIVTAMDLDDDEMVIYAQVLTGARARFPRGFQTIENSGKDKIKKYFSALLKAQQITPQEFAKRGGKYHFLKKYRLYPFLDVVSLGISDLLIQIDPKIRREDIPHLPERIEHLSEEKIRELIIGLVNLRGGGDPKKIKNFHFSGEFGYLYNKVFGGAPRLAIEFAYPNTYPQYAKKARELREKYPQPLCYPIITSGTYNHFGWLSCTN